VIQQDQLYFRVIQNADMIAEACADFSSRLDKRQVIFVMSNYVKFYFDFLERIDDLCIIKLSSSIASRLFFKITIARFKNNVNSILEISTFDLMILCSIVRLFDINHSQSYCISVVDIEKRRLMLQ